MKVNPGPAGGNAPGSAGPTSDTGAKESKTSAGETQGKKFENLLEEKGTEQSEHPVGAQGAKLLLGTKGGPNPEVMLKGKNLKLPQGVVQQEDAELAETLTGKGQPPKEGAPMTGKAFKSLLDQHQEPSAEDAGPKAGYEGLPLSAYLEPAAPAKPAETVQHAGLQVHEIEKMVDRVLVGVNASGEPEMRMDVHLDSLGPLNIQVTRGEEGLKIHFNCQ